MNKLCYRLVFNRARGQLMVVHEAARGNSKGGASGDHGTAGTTERRSLRSIVVALAAAFGASLLAGGPVSAQVVADRSVPGNQQATVITAANGVILVNVQSPSAAGVSRNVYTQFDVPKSGVILNNSRTDVQSQLGGWVQANPWLSTGGARVILNEVNSSNPSLLRGYIEVAGQRAEMVLANPAGIQIDGAGFINISRATLTTGTPVLVSGALDSYRVQRGAVTVAGAGLDASSTDYADVIARSVEINAGVWARQLNVTAGANVIKSGTDGGVAATAEASVNGTAPQFGIDVSQLGGMYANKIFLVGTEAGVGVRNAGRIGAAAGQLVVTSEGRLENSGTLAASDQLGLHVRGPIVNSGKGFADSKLDIDSSDSISNSGQLSAAGVLQLMGAALANSGLVHGDGAVRLSSTGGIDNRGGSIEAASMNLSSGAAIDNRGGKLIQTSTGGLDVAAADIRNTAGGSLGAPAAVAPPVTAASDTPPAGGSGAAQTPSGNNGSDQSASTPASAAPKGNLTAATVIDNGGGQIRSGGQIAVVAASLDNSTGQLNVDSLSLAGGSLLNRAGQINIGAGLTAQVGQLDNRAGSIVVGGAFKAATQTADNTDGLMQGGLLQLHAVGNLDNTRGVLRSTGPDDLQLQADGRLRNDHGKIEAAGHLVLQAGAFDGVGGAVTSAGNLLLDAGSATNLKGNWAVGGNALIHTGDFANDGGSLSARGDIALSADGVSNVGGSIAAGGALAVDTARGVDSRGGYLQAGAHLRLDAGGAVQNDGGVIETLAPASLLQINARSLDNGSGRITSVGQGDTVIAASDSIGNGGNIAANGKLLLSTATLVNQAGANIASAGDLNLAVSGTFTNAGGTVSSGGTLTFTQAGANLRNSGMLLAGSNIHIGAGTIDNRDGRIATAQGASADILIAAAALDNRAGTVTAGRDLSASFAGSLDNSGGALQSGRGLRLDAGGAVSNDGGAIEAAGTASTLSLQAASLNNDSGRIVNAGTGATTIGSGSIIASSGLIAGNGALVLSGKTLLNQGGGAISGSAIELRVSQQLDNLGGTISANGTLTFQQAQAGFRNSGQVTAGGPIRILASALDNSGGAIATAQDSGADLTVQANHMLNAGGSLRADRDLSLNSAQLDNTSGLVQAGRDLRADLAGALNNHSGVIEALGAASSLNVSAGTIDSSGRIVNVGNGAMQISATSLLNSGVLAGNGALSLDGASLTNFAGGAISSKESIVVRHAGASLTNHGNITAGGAIDLAVGAIDNEGGQIANLRGSGAGVNIDSASFNNRGGSVLADRDLALASRGGAVNDGGVMQAGKDLQLTAAGALSNNGGAIETLDGASSLGVQAGAIDNLAGRIVNAGTGDTVIGSGSTLANSGELSGAGSLAVSATTLSNQGAGVISSGSALQLAASARLDNLGATISSGGTLDFSQAGAAFNNSGSVVAAGPVRIQAASIDNSGGQLATAKNSGAQILLQAGSLVNHAGAILASGDASLSTAAAFDNSQGSVQAGTNLLVNAGGTLNNDGGAVEALAAASSMAVSAQAISSLGGRLVNVGTGATSIASQSSIVNGGLIAGNGALSLSGTVLDNQAGGTIGAGGALNLGLTQQLGNRGAISSAGTLSFQQAGASFSNSGALSAGGALTITAAAISNDGGQLATVQGSGASVVLQAQSLSNVGGKIFSNGDTSATVAGAVNNSGGTIQSANNLQVTAGGALSNVQGNLETASVGSSLAVQAASVDNTAGRIVNLGSGITHIAGGSSIENSGVIAGNGALNLSGSALYNRNGGSVQAGGALQLGLSGQVANAAGAVISSGGALTFQQTGARLDNGGNIVAGGAIAFNVADLSNDGGRIATASGSGADIVVVANTLSNRGGTILAEGAASFALAGGIDNRGGILHAGSNMQVSSGALVDNTGGVIEATGTASSLALQAQSLDNTAGRIVNLGSADTTVASQGSISNSGLIAGNGKLQLSATALQNSAGGAIESGGAMVLASSSLLANQGKINSGGTLDLLQAGAALNNSGQIMAGGDLHVNVAQVDNRGGQISTNVGSGASIAIASGSLDNQGGSISSDADLALAVQSLTAAGSLAAGRDLALNLGGDYSQAAGTQLHANRDLRLTVSGTLNNAGTLEAVRNLSLGAGQLNNASGALIQAQSVAVQATGAVRNGGDINGDAAVTVQAASIDNSNSIIGGDLVLQACSVSNMGAVALLGGTRSLSISASDSFNNSCGATIYSAFLMSNAATTARDANGALLQAGAVNNHSATIEAAGDLEISAASINNIRDNVVINKVTTVDETTHMTMPSWWVNGPNNNYYDSGSANYSAHEVYYVNPDDVLENTTYMTPDGYQIGRAVIRTHTNDTAFFSARSGQYSAYGSHTRILLSDGIKVIYYLSSGTASNPDQVAGVTSGIYPDEATVTHWQEAAPSYSNAYGNCASNCLRLVTQPGYDDPSTTLIRDEMMALAPRADKLEKSRDAHHTVQEDQLAAGAGQDAQIRSGGNMLLNFSQELNNSYGTIAARGNLAALGNGTGAQHDTFATLYATHQFNGSWTTYAGDVSNYTRPDLNQAIGQVGGGIQAGGSLFIDVLSFSNIDVSAGTAGNIRQGIQVIGSGASSTGLAASAGGSGLANHAGIAGNAAASGNGSQASATAAASAVAAVSGQGAGASDAAGASASGIAGAFHFLGRAAAGAPTGTQLGALNTQGGASLGNASATVQAAGLMGQGGAGAIAVAPTGLSHLNPAPDGEYLFETRSQFANKGEWTSSDFLLNALKFDPALTQKRLGDGFYEQRLVRDQLAELTGRQPASGLSDDAIYKAMLSNAVSYAEQWQLRPGIALSAEQVSQLTSDIVWLEKQAVRLPDGSVETVLVPKVYLARAGDGAVRPSGALITGDGVTIRAADIVNRGGVIDGSNGSGTGRTLLVASNDIVNQGGTIVGDSVLLAAGRDVVNQSLAAVQQFGSATSSGSFTSLAGQASIKAGSGTLVVQAGRDLNDVGGSISAGGGASLLASGDISLTALVTGSILHAQVAGITTNNSSVGHQLGSISTGGKLVAAAGRDLTLSGTQVSVSAGGASLVAGRDIKVAAVVDNISTDQHDAPGAKAYDKQVHVNDTVVDARIASSGNVAL